MTWGLRFQVKWVNYKLGCEAYSPQVILKVPLSRKTTRKVRAVEVPFGGVKTQKQLRCAEMGDSSKNLAQ